MPTIDPMDLQVQRDIGALTAEMRSLSQKVADLGGKLDDVYDALQQARGGWRVVAGLGGIAGGAAGFLATIAKMKLFGP